MNQIVWMIAIGLLGLLIAPNGVGAWSWTHGVRWLYVLALSTTLAYILTPLSMWAAKRLGCLDVPDPRKIHREPTPRLGGLAVFLATIFAVGRNFQLAPHMGGLLVGSSLIFLIGFWDDCRGLGARFRMGGQLVAALIVIGSGLRITFIPHIPGEDVLEIAITVVWLIGLTNAINFLDGIDGLAAGFGAFCSMLFFVAMWTANQSLVAFAMAALAGGCLGYLPYNWHPAKTFLGDGGSTFIGFTLAGLALDGTWAKSAPMVALAIPVLILGVPIFDMIYITVSRVKSGKVKTVKEWLEYVGKDHFHHRLLNLGLTVRQSVAFILLTSLCLGLGALVIPRVGALGSGLLLAQAIVLFLIIVMLMVLGRKIPTPRV